ncbi:MAG: hypothetical protein LRY54_03210 [Alphaproteobacteria bacterium]|nr:hypothetical protein [Alphaproteobacteria bacterium]
MGFKRTSEGRVFFQSGTEQDNPQAYSQANDPEQGQAASFNPPPISQPNQMQLQILGLLKSLNERLRATQADRDYLRSELETYKGLVHDLKRQAEGLESKIGAQKPGDADKSGELKKLASEAAKDLAETRKALSELEERAEKTESDLKRQVAQIRQNETAIIQKQAELEQLQQAHQAEIARRIEDRSRELSIGHTKQWEQLMARIEKREQAITLRLSHAEDQAKTASDKVEEAISGTAKLDRKLEKTLQDRTRLIRKLERIEETVIQTHDALNARAMVLLTDQNTASQSQFPYKTALDKSLAEDAFSVQGFVPGDEETATEASTAAQAPANTALWWKKPLRLNAPAMTGIVVVALLAGWFVSHVQTPDLPVDVLSYQEPPVTSDTSAQNDDNQAEAFLEPDSTTPESDAGKLTEPTPEARTEQADSQDPDFEKTMDRFIKDGSTEESNDLAAKDDLGTKALTDQDKIEALLENNPDAVAARLNEIEPGSAPTTEEASAQPLKTNNPEAVDLTETAQASSVDTAQAIPLKSIPAKEIKARIKPDPALPPVVKEIETKAFGGSPEAQHDLAAIYTAGHGGVKQDYKRAATWFQIAAEGGVANAAYNLGVLYHQGIGVKQDLKTALSWYQKSRCARPP